MKKNNLKINKINKLQYNKINEYNKLDFLIKIVNKQIENFFFTQNLKASFIFQKLFKKLIFLYRKILYIKNIFSPFFKKT